MKHNTIKHNKIECFTKSNKYWTFQPKQDHKNHASRLQKSTWLIQNHIQRLKILIYSPASIQVLYSKANIDVTKLTSHSCAIIHHSTIAARYFLTPPRGNTHTHTHTHTHPSHRLFCVNVKTKDHAPVMHAVCPEIWRQVFCSYAHSHTCSEIARVSVSHGA